jgi:hypothetical protein
MKHDKLLEKLKTYQFDPPEMLVTVGKQDNITVAMTNPLEMFNWNMDDILTLHATLFDEAGRQRGVINQDVLNRIQEIIRAQMIVMTMTTIEVFLENYITLFLRQSNIDYTGDYIQGHWKRSFQNPDFIKQSYKKYFGRELLVKNNPVWKRIFSKGVIGKIKGTTLPRFSYMETRHMVIHKSTSVNPDVFIVTHIIEDYVEECIIDAYILVSEVIKQFGEPKDKIIG